MGLPRMRSPRGATSRRVALWSALAVGGILPSVGCQVEYAGMTLAFGQVHARRRPVLPGRAGLPLGQHPGGDAAGADAGHGHRAAAPGRSSASHRAPARSTRSRTSSAGRRTSTSARLMSSRRSRRAEAPHHSRRPRASTRRAATCCRRVTRHRRRRRAAVSRRHRRPGLPRPPSPISLNSDSEEGYPSCPCRRGGPGESAGRDGVAQALGAASRSSQRRDCRPGRGRSRPAPFPRSSSIRDRGRSAGGMRIACFRVLHRLDRNLNLPPPLRDRGHRPVVTEPAGARLPPSCPCARKATASACPGPPAASRRPSSLRVPGRRTTGPGDPSPSPRRRPGPVPLAGIAIEELHRHLAGPPRRLDHRGRGVSVDDRGGHLDVAPADVVE